MSDFAAIMSRRRALADAKKAEKEAKEGGEEVDEHSNMEDSMADFGASVSSDLNASKSELHSSKTREDLQAIMARRRRLADGEAESSMTDMDFHASRSSGIQQGSSTDLSPDLQSIMEKRRRIAEGDKQDSPTASPARPAPSHVPRGTIPRNLAPISPVSLRSRTVATPASPTRASPREPAAKAHPVKSHLKTFGMGSDLQAIMARRKQLADGEAADAADAEDEHRVEPRRPSTGPTSEAKHQATGPSVVEEEDYLPRESQRRMSGSGRFSEHEGTEEIRHNIPSGDESEYDTPLEMDYDEDDTEQNFAASKHSHHSTNADVASSHSRSSIVGSNHSRRSGEAYLTASSGHSRRSTGSRPPEEEHVFKASTHSNSSSARGSRHSRASESAHDSDVASMAEEEYPDPDTFIKQSEEEEEESSDEEEEVPPSKQPSRDRGSSRNDTELRMEEVDAHNEESSAEDSGSPASYEKHGSSQRLQTSRRQSEDSIPHRESEASPRKISSPKHRKGHRRRSLAQSDEVSVDDSLPSVDSGGSRESGPKKPRSRRTANRRTSTGSSDGASLRALHAANRRESTGVATTDDVSRTEESVASSRTGPKRRGRRKSTTVDETLSSSHSGRRSLNRHDSSRSFEDIPPGRGVAVDKREVMRRRSTSSRSIDSDVRPSKPYRKKSSRQSHQQRIENETKDDAAADSGWGDFGAFAPAPAEASTQGPAPASAGNLGFDAPIATERMGFPAPAPAANSGFPAPAQTDAFSSFVTEFSDANFAGNEFPLPAAKEVPKVTPSDAFGGQNAFDATFGSPPAFGAATDIDSSTPQGFSAAFGSQEAFDQPMFSPPGAFGAKRDPDWDSSPLTNVPARTQEMICLTQKSILSSRFRATPVTNPRNGNIIIAASSMEGVFLRELDPHRDYLQTASVAILSAELQRKVATKYSTSVHGIESVVALTAGLHKAHGQTRVRVAAIVDLRVLESRQPMRLVAVWQWGYGSPHPITLQNALTPPSGGDFTYDPATLQIADNLLFVAGSSPKGPCMFMSKPTVRETWSANFLTGTGRVSAMAVITDVKRMHPYIAVALSDKSLSVWTYQEAIGNKGSGSEASKRWLFPVCRLEAASVLSSLEATSVNPEGTMSGRDAKDVGMCTHLAWLPPQPSLSSLVILAASFQNGLAVFHVALPVTLDPSKNSIHPLPVPGPGIVLSQTPSLFPFVAKRWQGKHERCSSVWVNLGPFVNPCLALLLHRSEAAAGSVNAKLLLGAINFPLYRKGLLPKERLLPFRILANKDMKGAVGLLQNGNFEAVLCHSVDELLLVSPSLPSRSKDGAVALLSYPIASNAPGLNSAGDLLLTDADSDKEGILHIFSVTQCERQKSEADATMLDWSRPTRRYWLCRTLVGDTKESTFDEAKEENGALSFGDTETVLGGASSDIVCELPGESFVGLTPFRIVRCPGFNLCAVLFRSALCSKAGPREALSLDAHSIALVDFTCANASIEMIEGRDISFWPHGADDPPCGVVLSRDGSCLTRFTWESSKKTQMETSFRPILGVDTDKNYVDCRRVFTFAGASKLGLFVVGTRLRDNCTCILTGDVCDVSEGTSSGGWSSLLPNLVTGRIAWLGEKEEVLHAVGLECDDNGYRNFAVATSSRVLILSSGLDVLAATNARVSCCCLAPLGSFAVSFSCRDKLRYLCCLDGRLNNGVIATFPLPKYSRTPTLLMAVRPDRFLLFQFHSSARLVEHGEMPNGFYLPTAVTRPALLLEPMLANAVGVGGKLSESTPILRAVVEKFGRKMANITHGESEGVGNLGAGITPRVFEILRKYGLSSAASWLLTGTVKFDRSANSKLLPSWMPIAPKAKGALNSDAFLHLVANGDQYLGGYIKSPDQGMPSTLPRESDPTTYICKEYARDALIRGKALDALKMLDLAGAESTNALILQLALLQGKDKSTDFTEILKTLSGYDNNGLSCSSASTRPSSSLAALAVSLRLSKSKGGNREMNGEQINRWMKPLAPSLQRAARPSRTRQTVFGEKSLEAAGEKKVEDNDPFFVSPVNESKHVWNEGPQRQKESLLMLDRIEDWLGRRRPALIGKEGASAARDRGEKTLADLLNADDDSFAAKSDLENDKDGWVEGVGEGRSDEANLSGYFRFSEGEDEDSPWRSEGLLDLSHYQNKAILVGNAEAFSLEPSTSSVDDGEAGKVKALYDLVFGSGSAGLAIPAPRGGSLDVGVLHTSDRQSRQRSTIEFWYHLPSDITSEIILCRRTMGPSADDFSKVSNAVDRDSALWELALRSTGEVEFRTCGGSSLISSKEYVPPDTAADDDEEGEEERKDLAKFGRWNHVCVVMSSRGMASTECSVSLVMKGTEVASFVASMRPPSFEQDDMDGAGALDEIMQKSHFIFGIGLQEGSFRLTELRVWACQRSVEDVSALMYEYLNAAEKKKKFQVKIKKGGATGALRKGAFFSGTKGKPGAPTKVTLSLAPAPKKSALAPPTKTSIAPSLAPPPKEPQKFPLAPAGKEEADVSIRTSSAAGFEATFPSFGDQQKAQEELQATESADTSAGAEEDAEEYEGEYEEELGLWDSAVPLSQQVRSSAAAALIRGPPATRHFGGNRGGLPDFSGIERFGVGGIAICGSEKTIVFRDNEDPPALTYPIGASGAIVSDVMDDEGSEFLAAFLAKERRCVVFELQSRTVVVEIQMTTKLNFWRFLPPEASGNTLCFMLVTPVGGFHWLPLEESPRPQQVWKRGSDLQGKKVVSYEEGGSNGLEGFDILSRVGLVMVTAAVGGGSLEAWLVPIAGDSRSVQVSDDVMGACLCQPPFVDDGPFLPLLLTVHEVDEGIFINVLSITAPKTGSIQLGDVEVTQEIDASEFEDIDHGSPSLAMGTYPEAICCSLANIVVVIVRRKGLVVAFELEDGDMSLIAKEDVGHYVVDAVMRYSAEVGGAEIVMLLSDEENPKDGRMVSFCFRSAA